MAEGSSVENSQLELDNAKHQIDFLLNLLNDLVISEPIIPEAPAKENSSVIERIVSNRLSEAKREEGILLLGRIISAQQTYIKLLEDKIAKHQITHLNHFPVTMKLFTILSIHVFLIIQNIYLSSMLLLKY
ncbi:MAG TPA: hypothetical protein VI033_01775 [Candidatus Nitrosopolaris sp.]